MNCPQSLKSHKLGSWELGQDKIMNVRKQKLDLQILEGFSFSYPIPWQNESERQYSGPRKLKTWTNSYQKLVNMANFFLNSFPKHSVANVLECKRQDWSKSCKRGFPTSEIIHTLNTSTITPAGMLLSILIIAINEPLAITSTRVWKTGWLPIIRKKSFLLKIKQQLN